MQINVSIYDLMSIEDVKKSIVAGDEQAFHNFLYTIGFDTKKEIESLTCLHRPMSYVTKEPIMGVLYIGTERNDAAWLASGNCTFENRMNMNIEGNIGLYKDMKKMSQQSNFTATLISHIKNKGV